MIINNLDNLNLRYTCQIHPSVLFLRNWMLIRFENQSIRVVCVDGELACSISLQRMESCGWYRANQIQAGSGCELLQSTANRSPAVLPPAPNQFPFPIARSLQRARGKLGVHSSDNPNMVYSLSTL